MRPARRRMAFFSAALATLVAVLALILPAGTASAAGRSAAETRVWAFSSAAPAHVGADSLVSADQRLGEPAAWPFYAPGACVAPEAGAGAGRVAVDANAVIRSLSDAGDAAKVDGVLAGRSPVLSPQALSEIKSFSSSDVMNWLGARGGSIGPEATSQGIAGLQAQAASLGRVLKVGDAAVADSAMQENLGIVTRGQRFSRFPDAIGWPVEGF